MNNYGWCRPIFDNGSDISVVLIDEYNENKAVERKIMSIMALTIGNPIARIWATLDLSGFRNVKSLDGELNGN